MAGHPINGKLEPWENVAEEAEWDTLFVGNGLSMNVWRDFGYGSLYEQAVTGTRFGSFAPEDVKLFEALDTENFERVLADLKAAIRVSVACGKNPDPFRERYTSVQAALAAAVRSVHIERVEIPDATLKRIRAALLEFEWVFTTSYDLLVYWAMGYGETFAGFCDCFWSHGRNAFDIRQTTIHPGSTPVFFVHGALHLIVEGDGTTRKLTRGLKTLLDQFGQPISGDPDARPLLVTEGSSQDKLVAIEGNDYLASVLQTLRARERPLVVFGHSLSDQDQHLVDAINVHPDVGKMPARAGSFAHRTDGLATRAHP